MNIKLSEVIGQGYNDFWNSKHLYRVVKGSRSSKKSRTTGLNFITRIMKYPGSNLLVIRKTYRTLKNSCFAELKWAIRRLKVEGLFEYKENPLEIIYKPTGQKIFFVGLDDPLKITSFACDVGHLCWIWIEEAYEILREEDFDMIDESLRGSVEPPLFKQITITFNPWNERHWLKKRFFDVVDSSIFTKTVNYLINEFLDEVDIKKFEKMKERNPRRYNVAGLGNWGISDGLVYENWKEYKFTLSDVRNCKTFCGLDFGYTNDPAAFIIGFIDKVDKIIYIWDELYETGLINSKLCQRITDLGYSKERITADCAEPKSIDELNELGLRVKGARKGKDSIMNGVQFIQGYEIRVHPRCVNFLTEISNYSFDKDKFGKTINKPIDDFNHTMDAMRYGIEDFIVDKNMEFSDINIFG